jgi:hypothetical protein
MQDDNLHRRLRGQDGSSQCCHTPSVSGTP